MSQIIQHIPVSVTGIKPHKIQYNTQEELFDIPFVENWAELDNFQGFHIASGDLYARIDGRHFLVGYLS